MTSDSSSPQPRSDEHGFSPIEQLRVTRLAMADSALTPRQRDVVLAVLLSVGGHDRHAHPTYRSIREEFGIPFDTIRQVLGQFDGLAMGRYFTVVGEHVHSSGSRSPVFEVLSFESIVENVRADLPERVRDQKALRQVERVDDEALQRTERIENDALRSTGATRSGFRGSGAPLSRAELTHRTNPVNLPNKGAKSEALRCTERIEGKASPPKPKTTRGARVDPWTVALTHIPDGSPLRKDQFREAWAEWTAHRREIGKPLTNGSIKRQIRDCLTWGVDRSIAAIECSIRNGWTGLFEPRSGSDDGANSGAARVRGDRSDWESVDADVPVGDTYAKGNAGCQNRR